MAIAKNKEQLRDRLDLADVIGSYIPLKRASANSFKALCPFHADKNPSLTVTPHMGIWQCWSCGAKGDVFSFVMQIENVDFGTALELLASKIGFTLEYEQGGGQSQFASANRARILSLNLAAAQFFELQLASEEAAIARQNLLERGFDQAAAARFGVGYSPNSFTALSEHLRGLGYTEAELLESTLARRSDRTGGLYDFYRGRLMWPIRDQSAAVIGFGARKLHADDTGPKYYNSSDSPVYHKNRVLYGIDVAKSAIARQGQVVLVEGYTDVMAAHLAGVETAMATCGTAFTDEHVNVINRLLGPKHEGTAEIIFCFDPDEAGQKAAMRAWQKSGDFRGQTFVAVGPGGLDPCDLRAQRGDAAVQSMIAARKPIHRYMIEQSIAGFDLSNLGGRLAAGKAAAPVIAAVRDEAARSAYERELAEWVSLDASEVRAMVQEAIKSAARAGVAGLSRGNVGGNAGGGGQQPDPAAGGEGAGASVQVIDLRMNLADPTLRVERQVLEVIVQLPGCYSSGVLNKIVSVGLVHPLHLAVARAVQAALPATGAVASGPGWLDEVRAKLPQELHPLLTTIAGATLPAADDAALQRYGQGVMVGALDRALNVEKHDLMARLRRLAADDPGSEEFAEVNRRLMALELDRRKLREGRA